MYGMVNKAIQDLITSRHGEEKWSEIKQRAGVEDEIFISNEGYPDAMTYQLVGAAVEVLGVPADQILRQFGEYWVLETAQVGYGALLKAGGKTLPEFLVNLPNFHTRVTMMLPHLVPPRFECSEIADHSLKLHYFTHRPGLTDFVVGLVQGLGKLFETPAEAALIESKADGADHDIFLVTWVAQAA